MNPVAPVKKYVRATPTILSRDGRSRKPRSLVVFPLSGHYELGPKTERPATRPRPAGLANASLQDGRLMGRLLAAGCGRQKATTMTDAKRRGRHHAPSTGAERRRSPRRPAALVPNLKARLLAGPDVRLVDVSRRGVLLETDTRLMPGSPIRVKFVADDSNLVMKGCVVRSSVAVVSGTGLVYRTAISFDEDISICDESLWHEDPAPPPEPAQQEPPPPHAPHPTEPPATVTATFAASTDDLRSLLAANDW